MSAAATMGRTRATIAWALSLAPSLASGAAADSLAGGSRLALALLPWIALIGLPPGRSARRARAREPRGWPAALALALPPLGLAAWLDRAGGLAADGILATAAVALPLLCLLGEARHAAGRGGGGLYGMAWSVLLPGAPALWAALGWASSGRGEPAALVAWLAGLSPLSWAWGRFAGPGTAGGRGVTAWGGALLAALALWSLAAFAARAERGEHGARAGERP